MDDLSQFCCLNSACPDYGIQGKPNLSVCARYGPDKERRMLRCATCRARFSERKGTPFFRARMPSKKLDAVLKHVAEGCGVRETSRLVGVHRDTVTRYSRLESRLDQNSQDEPAAYSPELAQKTVSPTPRRTSRNDEPSQKPRRKRVSELHRQRLSETLAHQIKKDIIDRGLKPGDSLATEEEISQRYGVSRSIVREATKALDFLGIINTSPRRGIVLEEFNFNRATEFFGFHFALSDYPKEKILKTRAIIETGALYYTLRAMQKDPTIYDRLRIIAEEPNPNEDIDLWIEHDIAFHRALVEVNDTPPLEAFCDLLHVFFRVYRNLLPSGPFKGGKEGHLRILDALRRSDLDASVNALLIHLYRFETNGIDPVF
jgi:GntR family transcriptional regulator, transcriptional repressor for pyruvate dehydrogenase complex